MKARLLGRWRQLPQRDRQLCGVLAVFLAVIVGVYGLWLPAQQRQAAAHRLYDKQLALATQLQQARPVRAAPVFDQPLSTRLSESAASAGLAVQQFDLDADGVRITLSGDAVTLLAWLNRIEHEGAVFQSLALDKRDASLEARLYLNN